ncbi:MAG: TldD/PmbA family protein [Negativicutes bacterium]|nr:TldD/PmbA family protein [Negativicutes bacterium]
MQYLELATQAVKEAEKAGAYNAEAYVLDARSLTVEVADQALETLKFANDTGIGVRVISPEGRVGFAFSTDIAPASLAALARQAVANGKSTAADRHNVLPPTAGGVLPALKMLDPKIAAMSVEDKIEMAKRVEASARQTDPRVRRTERCVYEDAEYGVALANSRQLAVQYRSGYCGLYGVVLAEADGDVQPGMGIMYRRDFDLLNPESVGREAALEASRLVGAKSIGTTQAALVLSPHVATNFFAVLIPALSADAVQKGRSLFRNKVGKTVASTLISLVDDGRLDGGIATAPVDGEGVPSRRTELIADGVLQGYLYNTYTAGRDGVTSTGNGVRHSFKSGPEVGPTNIFLQPGGQKPADIISQVRDGFYVTSVMGMHTANPISGDFSVGAAGVWIKDGAFAQAVRGVAIAGNILDLMAGVDAVGDDLRFFGSQGAPTVRIDKITVSGG